MASNIMHFARALRAAGLPIGPGDTLTALDAVRRVGLRSREDFYWTLHAVFVNRADQRDVFDQAFHVFWRNPKLLEQMMAMLLPSMQVPGEEDKASSISRRVQEALAPARSPDEPTDAPDEIELDAALTWSDREVLQEMDFEQMSNDELARAKAAIARLRLPLPRVATRRFRAHPNGRRIDMRNTLRKSLRTGSSVIPLSRRSVVYKPPPLVILCDISGSMSRYSRMLLHFSHAIMGHRTRVHSFVFGTRLTNVSRYLREKDVDAAMDRVAEQVEDWSGGTRMGHCLEAFNKNWSRRVCGQGAVVVLISDGLDRDSAEGLSVQIERLHKSCRRLLWLNPLLRYDQFEPRAAGIRAILPHVDDFRPVHNLNSLEQLVDALRDNNSPAPVSRYASS
ncbi:MAG: hypothetical protein ACI9W2_003033, partial [Gammaproteobacteria bacterium]